MRKDIYLSALLLSLLVSCTELDELFGKDDKLRAGTASTAVTDDGQLYNMGFDLWCTDKDGDIVCYDSLATDDQKRVWGSANSSTASFGKPTCTPDSVMVAVEGEGKNAVKLQTQLINAVITKKLAAGSIFTGSMGSVSLTSLTATLKWGIPFTLKPKALEGYACYQPKSINVADKAHGDLKGTLDKGHVFVMLTDWDKQFTVDPAKEKFVAEDDEHVMHLGAPLKERLRGIEACTGNVCEHARDRVFVRARGCLVLSLLRRRGDHKVVRERVRTRRGVPRHRDEKHRRHGGGAAHSRV